MVVSAGDVGAECIFAGVAAGSVSAVMAEGDGLCQGNVQSQHTSDGHGDLRDFQCVCQAGSLVIVREDKDLCLAGQAPERRRVENAIPVAFEARAEGILVLLSITSSGTDSASRERSEIDVGGRFAFDAVGDVLRADSGPGIGVRKGDADVRITTGHCGDPPVRALVLRRRLRVLHPEKRMWAVCRCGGALPGVTDVRR